MRCGYYVLGPCVHSARLQSPCQSFALAFLTLLRRLAQPRHRPASDPTAVDPVLHGPRLGPRPEVEHAIAGILPPASQRHVLAGRGDALAHNLDLALVLGTERIVALNLGDERHALLFGRYAVFTPAPAHVNRSTTTR